MILIIKTNKEKLHDLEFVKPIEEIVQKKFITKHYSQVKKEDLKKAEKIIICGTSLKDNKFIEDIKEFGWIKEFDKPILGICAGMQIIGLLFGGKLKKKKEIGFYRETFTKEFLGLKGEQKVYHLHNNYVSFPSEFESFAESEGIVQAVKHKNKEIYGVLFHPEVRQKNLIREFVKL